MIGSVAFEKITGLGFVIGLHIVTFWFLWQSQLSFPLLKDATLFVSILPPPVSQSRAQPKSTQLPQKKSGEQPRPQQLIADTPAILPTNSAVPAQALTLPVPETLTDIPAVHPSIPLQTEPVSLGSELAVACQDRTPPRYPSISRRLGEEGTTVLRVELDETGRVVVARVNSSSGHARLDEAALTVVKSWRCTPAQRDGQPVRAVALQPFKFILQGS